MATQGILQIWSLDQSLLVPSALEYEKRHNKDLQPFFDSSIPKLSHSEVKEWGVDLISERAHTQAWAESQNPEDKHWIVKQSHLFDRW